jgi:hypothetical protein
MRSDIILIVNSLYFSRLAKQPCQILNISYIRKIIILYLPISYLTSAKLSLLSFNSDIFGTRSIYMELV